MVKRKFDAKSFSQQKRKRRQWITFVRMCRYGVNNFSRNAWLTVAATAVMTITLLIIFITLASRQVLADTVGQIRDNVSMSIYVKTDTNSDQAQAIKGEIEKLSSVKSVTYVNPSDARKAIADDNSKDNQVLDALNQATNKLPGTFQIRVNDINDPSQLRTFATTNDLYLKYADPNRPASFDGKRRTAIDTIGRWAQFAEKAGLVASVVFILISSLIVFNTIRMAIFNRKEEIQMMKLIGADKSFIRGPFVVEAVVYGFIAAIIATILGYVALYTSADKLISYEINIQPTMDRLTIYVGFVLLAMIAAGAIVGVISSLLATRKYLRSQF